jgi:hypothetical protein
MSATSSDASKVRSLLEINKTLAKENTFLSQQFDVLSKECASLSHMLRSKVALSNAREMELKSALESAKQALRGKETMMSQLEEKVKHLEELLALAEGRGEMIDGKVAAAERGHRESTPRSSEMSSKSDLAYLEANHPWMSPVLLRLDRLSNEGDNEFKVPPHKRFSPPEKIHVDLTRSEDQTQEASSTDAVSCTNVPLTTPEPTGPALSLPSVREDEGETSSLKTPVTGAKSSLRRRNAVNYALPSLNSKLRQGDAHTFGSADFERGTTPRRKKSTSHPL